MTIKCLLFFVIVLLPVSSDELVDVQGEYAKQYHELKEQYKSDSLGSNRQTTEVKKVFEDFSASLKRLLQDVPEPSSKHLNWDDLFALAEAFEMLREPEMAVSYGRQAVLRRGESAPSYFSLLRSLLNLNRVDEANKVLVKAKLSVKTPEELDAFHCFFHEILKHQGAFEDALSHLEKFTQSRIDRLVSGGSASACTELRDVMIDYVALSLRCAGREVVERKLIHFIRRLDVGLGLLEDSTTTANTEYAIRFIELSVVKVDLEAWLGRNNIALEQAKIIRFVADYSHAEFGAPQKFEMIQRLFEIFKSQSHAWHNTGDLLSAIEYCENSTIDSVSKRMRQSYEKTFGDFGAFVRSHQRVSKWKKSQCPRQVVDLFASDLSNVKQGQNETTLVCFWQPDHVDVQAFKWLGNVSCKICIARCSESNLGIKQDRQILADLGVETFFMAPFEPTVAFDPVSTIHEVCFFLVNSSGEVIEVFLGDSEEVQARIDFATQDSVGPNSSDVVLKPGVASN